MSKEHGCYQGVGPARFTLSGSDSVIQAFRVVAFDIVEYNPIKTYGLLIGVEVRKVCAGNDKYRLIFNGLIEGFGNGLCRWKSH